MGDDDDGGLRDAVIAWWATDHSGSQHPSVFGAGRLEGPQKAHVRATTQGTGVLLKWTHFAWNDAYEVHRSASPYFTPAEGTRLRRSLRPATSIPIRRLPAARGFTSFAPGRTNSGPLRIARASSSLISPCPSSSGRLPLICRKPIREAHGRCLSEPQLGQAPAFCVWVWFSEALRILGPTGKLRVVSVVIFRAAGQARYPWRIALFHGIKRWYFRLVTLGGLTSLSIAGTISRSITIRPSFHKVIARPPAATKS